MTSIMLFTILLVCSGMCSHPESSVHRCLPTCSDQVKLKLLSLSLSCCCYNIKVSPPHSVEFSPPGQDGTPGVLDNWPRSRISAAVLKQVVIDYQQINPAQ